jgi:hypothetical protein
MNLKNFLHHLNNTPENIEFKDTMAVIEALYDFTPTSFKNGELLNEAGKNSGSCKLFAFAQLQQLNPQQTLACFGAYYRDDVLKNPLGTDHQNIRNFQTTAWAGIKFDSNPLIPKVVN